MTIYPDDHLLHEAARDGWVRVSIAPSGLGYIWVWMPSAWAASELTTSHVAIALEAGWMVLVRRFEVGQFGRMLNVNPQTDIVLAPGMTFGEVLSACITASAKIGAE